MAIDSNVSVIKGSQYAKDSLCGIYKTLTIIGDYTLFPIYSTEVIKNQEAFIFF